MTDNNKPKPIIIDSSDIGYAKIIQTDKEWEKWDRENPSRLLILDDYRQLVPNPALPISKKQKNLLKEFKKYNPNVEITFITHKPNTPVKQLPSIIDLYLWVMEQKHRHRKNKKK